MKRILFIMFFGASLNVSAQTINISIFNESTSFPFAGFAPIHPGVEAGLTFYLRERDKSIQHVRVNFGYYYHKKVENCFFLNSEYSFRPKIKDFITIDVSGSMGYLRTFYPGEVYLLNNEFNNWRHEDIIEHAIGETHYYSNTNYLLLGMILENMSDMSLEWVYKTKVFQPLKLSSAYFDKSEPIPCDVVKGYANIYGNDQFVESTFLYKDELNTADGGIAVTAYDLTVFFEELMNGNIISNASLNQMTSWLDLREDWINRKLSHTQDRYGIEHFPKAYVSAVGHARSIFGFNTLIQHFPDKDATYTLLINSASDGDSQKFNLYTEVLDEMFN